MAKKKKTKKEFSKAIVSLVVFLNIAFTMAVLYVFLKTGNEPTVLVGSWFAFTTGELWLLSSIKKTKEKIKKIDVDKVVDEIKSQEPQG